MVLILRPEFFWVHLAPLGVRCRLWDLPVRATLTEKHSLMFPKMVMQKIPTVVFNTGGSRKVSNLYCLHEVC